jgi:hypothetical protein
VRLVITPPATYICRRARRPAGDFYPARAAETVDGGGFDDLGTGRAAGDRG